MYMRKKVKLSILSFFLFSSFALGQKVQIVLIGTYHEPSLASQVFNAPVHDVLSTNQMSDIETIAYFLAKWKPDYLLSTLLHSQQTETEQKYKAFLNNPAAFQEDILEQLVFRTAQKYPQTQLINIDSKEQIEFSGVIGFAETNKQADKIRQIQKLVQPVLFSERQIFLKRDYFSFLQYLNSSNFTNTVKKDFINLNAIGTLENPVGAVLASAITQKTAQWVTAIHQLKSPQRIVLFLNAKYLPALRYWLEGNSSFEIISWEKIITNKKVKK
jgi:hypothetical protein